MTRYKASKSNKRGPKGKKTRRSALRGNAEENGECTKKRQGWMEGGDGRDVSWRLSYLVVPPSAFRIHDKASLDGN